MVSRIAPGSAARHVGRAGLLCCLLFTACGSGGLNPVRGKVLVKGQPAQGVVAVFHPTQGDPVKAQRPSGVTGEDGTFTLATNEGPGAPAGEYVVTLTWPQEAAKPKMSIAPPPDPVDRLQGRYATQAKSKIKVQVKPGSNELEPFQID